MLPLTPAEVESTNKTHLPDFVIEAVNELLIRHYSNHSTTILYQDDLVELVKVKMQALEALGGAEKKFDNSWLDIERTYGVYGWNVVYEKPGYNETGRSFFKFTKQFLR